jgi:RNA polymerase sigma-70 factor (ECF subfamily)
MLPDASPDRRTLVRVSADEQVTLFFPLNTQRGTARLVDTSSCGSRIRHQMATMNIGSSFSLQSASLSKHMRAVWTRQHDGFHETGLITDEAFLITRLLAGENEALVPLLAPHMRQVKAAIHSILRNHADAEDVLQNSVLKVMAHAGQFHPGNSFKAWLLQIATHEALKLAQRKKQRARLAPPLLLQVRGDEEMPDWVDPAASPADELASKEFEAAFSAAVQSLNEIYKQIFILRQIRELSMPEIAAELGITLETAYTRLHRARLLVYLQLQHICPRRGDATTTHVRARGR